MILPQDYECLWNHIFTELSVGWICSLPVVRKRQSTRTVEPADCQSDPRVALLQVTESSPRQTCSQPRRGKIHDDVLTMAKRKVLLTGASGYIAGQLLPEFRELYDLTLIDVKEENREGEKVAGIVPVDLIDPDRSLYAHHFEGIDAVVHLGHKPRSGDSLDHFFVEKQNVEMAYNVFRCAYESDVPRVVMASSNHAADWYEHALIHSRKMESLDPYKLPLSDNFYGWAKATYEHLGFLFACGFGGWKDETGELTRHDGGVSSGRKMGVVMVRIGAPRELELGKYEGEPRNYKRDLGSYISQRDLTQLFVKSIETENIDNEYGVPWQVVYGISDNTRAFWSLSNARDVFGYAPEDDSEVKYADDIRAFLTGEEADSGVGRVGM